jgi:hypothetical protein
MIYDRFSFAECRVFAADLMASQKIIQYCRITPLSNNSSSIITNAPHHQQQHPTSRMGSLRKLKGSGYLLLWDI